MLDVPNHELIQDVSTRWNSCQQMMERLVEQRRVIMDIFLDLKITKENDSTLLLKGHEWEMMSEMFNVLKDFSVLTTNMCSEKYMSVSQIFLINCGLLLKSLVINEDDNSAVRRTKGSIWEELNRGYNPSENETVKKLPCTGIFSWPAV